ncbi:hypothetical protein N7532_005773, partial [Penicillium argentinense]
MKTTSIFTALMGITAAVAAGPNDFKRDLQALKLTKLNAGLYDQHLPSTRIVNFDLNDPNSSIDTTCSAAWSTGMAASYKFNCTNPKYQVNFPSLYDIKDMKLNVSITGSKAFGLGEVNGDKWNCEKTGAEYPSETCEWDGVYEIPL